MEPFVNWKSGLFRAWLILSGVWFAGQAWNNGSQLPIQWVLSDKAARVQEIDFELNKKRCDQAGKQICLNFDSVTLEPETTNFIALQLEARGGAKIDPREFKQLLGTESSKLRIIWGFCSAAFGLPLLLILSWYALNWILQGFKPKLRAE